MANFLVVLLFSLSFNSLFSLNSTPFPSYPHLQVARSSVVVVEKIIAKRNSEQKLKQKRNALSSERDNKKDEHQTTWIVHLHPSHSHEAFESNLLNTFGEFEERKLTITRRYSDIFHGVAIKGQKTKELSATATDTEDARRAEIAAMPGVLRVVKDSKKKLSFQTWGLDRIDQPNLPLSSSYNAYFNGANVDVYIVDTGIDTTHVEFSGGVSRTVQNIWSDYSASQTNPGSNTDGQGHGTHVAGEWGWRK